MLSRFGYNNSIIRFPKVSVSTTIMGWWNICAQPARTTSRVSGINDLAISLEPSWVLVLYCYCYHFSNPKITSFFRMLLWRLRGKRESVLYGVGSPRPCRPFLPVFTLTFTWPLYWRVMAVPATVFYYSLYDTLISRFQKKCGAF